MCSVGFGAACAVAVAPVAFKKWHCDLRRRADQCAASRALLACLAEFDATHDATATPPEAGLDACVVASRPPPRRPSAVAARRSRDPSVLLKALRLPRKKASVIK